MTGKSSTGKAVTSRCSSILFHLVGEIERRRRAAGTIELGLQLARRGVRRAATQAGASQPSAEKGDRFRWRAAHCFVHARRSGPCQRLSPRAAQIYRLLIGQFNREYVAALCSYIKVIEQRNSLLRSFAKGGISRASAIEQLGFWDQQLSEHGSIVSAVPGG